MEQNESLNKLIHLIQSIIKDPHQYNINRVENIENFIFGYEIASADSVVWDFMDGFNKLVISNNDFTDQCGWTKLIRLHSNNDNHSLEQFRKYFEQYLDMSDTNMPTNGAPLEPGDTIHKLLETIYNIVKRPPMYSVWKVEDISYFLAGYEQGLTNEAYTQVHDFINGFELFLNKHFKTKKKYPWYRLIRFYSGSEWHSIESFGRYLDAYLEKMGIPKKVDPTVPMLDSWNV